jgi:uncharacterized protein YndB with AHSA1/START domain
MKDARFQYVVYISATAETVWQALVEPQVTAKYWQHVNVSDWKTGSRWEHHADDVNGPLYMAGKVLESDAPRHLVLTWPLPGAESPEEEHSRVDIEIEPFREVVRLTVTHDRLEPGSEMLSSITEGWPKVLSSLKTFLETGRPLPKLW